MNAATLTTVTEAQADDATAAIFADIRETMGVALVNLIWRHLAVSPDALNWSWQSLKPLYASGAVPRAAWALRQTLAVPELPAFSKPERLALGNSMNDLALIDAVLRTYERGNAQNLVALCALRSALAGPATDLRGAHGDGDGGQGSSITARAEQVHAERADRVTEALPPLPTMAELNVEIRADIESLAEFWVPAQHRGLIPSVFRHLAHWPALLRIYRAKLLALPPAPVSVAERAVGAVHQATRSATSLVAQLGAPAALAPDNRNWLGGALNLFIDGMIGRGVIIVPAMRKVLPNR